ncbi:hypothetical protein Ndes2526B_g06504 [Nannochloris sp. 'desiccata']
MDSASDPDTSGDEVFSDVDSEDQEGVDDEEMEEVPPHANGVGQHAPKRRKLAGRTAREALHGVGDGIDHAEDAEASLLDLEVRELLEEAAVSEDDSAVVHSIALQITSIIKALPEAEVNPSPIAALLSNFDFPVSRKFTFKPPRKVEIIGSFAIEGTCLPSPCLDLAVVMPASCFDNKDQLNHRYHAKRALYLSHVADALQNKKIAKQLGLAGNSHLQWTPFRGDPRRPVLIVDLQHGTASGATLRIIPVATSDLFPLQKLAPTRNNLRSICNPAAPGSCGNAKKIKTNENTSNAPAIDPSSELLPTPYYNAGILQDMLMLDHSRTLQKIAKNASRLGEASILLRVWAERHRLPDGEDGVDGFFLTNLLAQLLQTGKASSGMSSMHLFRTTLMALHHPKAFVKDTLAMQRASSGFSSSPPPTLKAYRSASSGTSNTSLNEVIFLDASGWLNLSNYISSAALKQAQVCAKRTAALLSVSAGPDAFDAAFLAGYPLASLYDVWYKVTIPAIEEEKKTDLQPRSAQKLETRTSKKKKTAAAESASKMKGGPSSRYYAADVPEWIQWDKKSVEIATKALGTRATLVRAFFRGCSGGVRHASTSSPGSIIFGPSREYTLVAARIDPTHALRGVDIGPAADSGAPAAQFRAFWGEKSELRRFQDGKISEAVVWETTPSQRHLIVDNIVQYALKQHLPSGTRVSRCSGLLDDALKRKSSTADDDVAATRLVEAAAARLGKRLRTLDRLPLQIVGTQPLAPVLRHADVFPPRPHLLAGAATADLISDLTSSSIPRCLPAVELLCQLEGSGKWPDGPAAFAKMKAAVGVQLAQLLHSGFGIEASAAEDYVDILSDGFAFRLILHTERDVAMQQLALTASGMPHLPPEEDIALRMWHHGAISAAAAANPAFEPSVRLAKRWIASQWLSPHFRDEAIELLVAAAFASGNSVIAPPPGSRVSGFLRFLHVLGNHPWTATPLVGDIAAGDPGPGRREVAARAHAAQKAEETGAPAMFITGPKDDQCVGWTREHPTRAILHRAAVLARRAVDKLEEILISSSASPLKGKVGKVETEAADSATEVLESVFVHDESDYEVLIRLRADALPTHDNTTRYKNKAKANKSVGAAGWSAVEPNDSPEESKKSRAVLKGIPKSVVEARGAAAVRKELLVGFNPVPLYVSLLEDRFGAVAVPCADYLGGTSVGLKLRGPALQPGLLRPEAAHATKPLGGVVPKDFDDSLVVVPDLEAVAADCLALGKGLVERVEFRKDL